MRWFLHPVLRGVDHGDLRLNSALAELARHLLDEWLPTLGNRAAGDVRLAATLERCLKDSPVRASPRRLRHLPVRVDASIPGGRVPLQRGPQPSCDYRRWMRSLVPIWTAPPCRPSAIGRCAARSRRPMRCTHKRDGEIAGCMSSGACTWWKLIPPNHVAAHGDFLVLRTKPRGLC